MAVFADGVKRGLRSAQPTPAAGAAGTLYYVTDESVMERWSGSAWQDVSTGSAIADILDIPTAEMDDTLVLAPDGAGGVEFRAEGGGGGGGGGWSLEIDDDGSSFGAWTSSGGTWASAGGKITQTDTGTAWRRAYHTVKSAVGYPWVMQADMLVVAGGQRVGLGIGDGSNGGLSVHLIVGTGIQVDRDELANIRTITTTIAVTTTYTLRVVCGSAWISIYLDGTFMGSVPINGSAFSATAEKLVLISYGASVTFDDIKLWTLDGPA